MSSPSRDDLAACVAQVNDALRLIDQPAGMGSGLLNGSCGVALFHAYHYRWSQSEEQLERLAGIVADQVAALAAPAAGHSHCGGLSGVAWCLQHLSREGFLDPEDTEMLCAQVDPMLARAMDVGLAAGQHDFLHEALGVALYFLERLPDPGARLALERAVERLAATAVETDGAIRWRDGFTERGRDAQDGPLYNLGLAHGSPAIIAVLARIHAHGIAEPLTRRLLAGALRWLAAVRDANRARDGQAAPSISLYPNLVTHDHRPVGPSPTRLGWCYGDLGVAVALRHAAAALEDRDGLAEADAVLARSLTHRDVDNGAIDDAGLCHGSAGVSHIYRRAHAATGDPAFAAGAERWLAHTVALGRSPIAFRAKVGGEHVECLEILQGVAGVGLALLAALDPETAPSWDRCLLLS